MPDLSVIIPTFRRPGQLVEAVTGSLAQSGVDLEVLVLDASPEGSARAAVDGIGDPRVSYHYAAVEQSKSRPAMIRNQGWPRARGRYLHFLDDDDRAAEGAYRAMLDLLASRPDRGVVFGRIEPFGDDEQALRHERPFFADAARRARTAARLGSRRWMITNILFRPSVLVTSACMIRKECVASLSGFDESLLLAEDFDFFVRAIRRFGCLFLDRTVLQYRVSATSLMHREKDNQKIKASYEAIYARYRAAFGATELRAMQLLARTVLRWL